MPHAMYWLSTDITHLPPTGHYIQGCRCNNIKKSRGSRANHQQTKNKENRANQW